MQKLARNCIRHKPNPRPWLAAPPPCSAATLIGLSLRVPATSLTCSRVALALLLSPPPCTTASATPLVPTSAASPIAPLEEVEQLAAQGLLVAQTTSTCTSAAPASHGGRRPAAAVVPLEPPARRVDGQDGACRLPLAPRAPMPGRLPSRG